MQKLVKTLERFRGVFVIGKRSKLPINFNCSYEPSISAVVRAGNLANPKESKGFSIVVTPDNYTLVMNDHNSEKELATTLCRTSEVLSVILSLQSDLAKDFETDFCIDKEEEIIEKFHGLDQENIEKLRKYFGHIRRHLYNAGNDIELAFEMPFDILLEFHNGRGYFHKGHKTTKEELLHAILEFDTPERAFKILQK